MKNLLVLIIILASFSCRLDNDNEKQKEEVKATLTKMWDAIEKEDIEAYQQYVHPDFTQFGEYDSTLRVGKEAEIEGIQSWMDESDNIHTEPLEYIFGG